MSRTRIAVALAAGALALAAARCAPASFTYVAQDGGVDATAGPEGGTPDATMKPDGSPLPDGAVPPDAASDGATPDAGPPPDGSVPPAAIWAHSFGTTTTEFDKISALAVGSSGEVYAVGYFGSPTDFGNGQGVIDPNSTSEPFAVAFSPLGALTWASPYLTDVGGAGVFTGAVLDPASQPGSLVAVGWYDGQITLGGTTFTSVGTISDALVVGIDPDAGAVAWAQTFGNTTSPTFANAVAIDPRDDSVVVTGNFDGTSDFGPSDVLQSAGQDDVFVATLSAGHVYQNTYKFGGAGDEDPTALAVDYAGNRVVAGRFTGQTDFGALDGGTTTDMFDDVFVVSVPPGGSSPQWLYTGGGSKEDRALAVAVDAVGDVYVTGYFTTQIVFDHELTAIGAITGFVAKFDQTSGAIEWSFAFGSNGDTSRGSALGFVQGVDAGSAELVLGGVAGSGADFGNGMVTRASGPFIARVNPSNGQLVALQTIPGTQAQAFSVYETPSTLYAAGTFQPPLDPGGPLVLDSGTAFIVSTTP